MDRRACGVSRHTHCGANDTQNDGFATREGGSATTRHPATSAQERACVNDTAESGLIQCQLRRQTADFFEERDRGKGKERAELIGPARSNVRLLVLPLTGLYW